MTDEATRLLLDLDKGAPAWEALKRWAERNGVRDLERACDFQIARRTNLQSTLREVVRVFAEETPVDSLTAIALIRDELIMHSRGGRTLLGRLTG